MQCIIMEKHIYPSLVLVEPRKTRPCLTENFLTGRKESNQTNKQTNLASEQNSRSIYVHVRIQRRGATGGPDPPENHKI